MEKKRNLIGNFQPNNLGKITKCKLAILKPTRQNYYLSYYFETEYSKENQYRNIFLSIKILLKNWLQTFIYMTCI